MSRQRYSSRSAGHQTSSAYAQAISRRMRCGIDRARSGLWFRHKPVGGTCLGESGAGIWRVRAAVLRAGLSGELQGLRIEPGNRDIQDRVSSIPGAKPSRSGSSSVESPLNYSWPFGFDPMSEKKPLPDNKPMSGAALLETCMKGCLPRTR